jgi:hypothetical protein
MDTKRCVFFSYSYLYSSDKKKSQNTSSSIFQSNHRKIKRYLPLLKFGYDLRHFSCFLSFSHNGIEHSTTNLTNHSKMSTVMQSSEQKNVPGWKT